MLFGIPVTDLAAGLPAGTELSQFASLPELLADLAPGAGGPDAVPAAAVDLELYGFPVAELALYLVGAFELSTIESRDGVLDLVAAATEGGSLDERLAILQMLERLGLFADGSVSLAELQGEIDLFGLTLGEMAAALDGVDLDGIDSLADLQAAVGNPGAEGPANEASLAIPPIGAPAFTAQVAMAFDAFDNDAATLGAALTEIGRQSRLAA